MISDNNKIIALTGTPGTGKTTLGKMLAEDLEFELVNLNELIEKKGIYESDSEGTRLVDPKDLGELKELSSSIEKGTVIEGHLSHLLPPENITDVIILRTNPKVLRKRLEERDYPEKKIEDNVESEALDIILEEAIQKHGIQKVLEIDNTTNSPSESLEKIKKGLTGESDLTPGSIDWLEEYFEEK